MRRRSSQKRIASLLAAAAALSLAYTAAADNGVTQLVESQAQRTAIERLPGGLQGKISLDLRNIDIVDALKFLALKANLNIVVTKNVTGRITLTVEHVTVQDIFDIMLRANNLAFMKQGDIYNIMTAAEYKELFGKNFSDIRVVKTFRLNYAIPEQAFTLVDTLKSDIGRVLVEPDSGTVLIMDTPDTIMEIEKALATLEQKNDVRVFNLQYANAKDVEDQLKSQLDAKKVGSIRADERLNQVIVQALPARMQDVEQMILALDKKTKQVVIDTKIVKVKLSDTKDEGVEWEGIFKIGAKYGMNYFGSTPFSVIQDLDDAFRTRLDALIAEGGQVGSIPTSGTQATGVTGAGSGAVTPGERMHIGIVDRQRDFDLFLKFLQTIGNTQILSNPKLAVVNNQEARLHVGEREAYVTSTTTTGQTTTTVSEEVTFIDIGIQLAVTPTINDDGYIMMKIKPEISSVTDTLETPSGNKIPIIDTSTAETTVLVKDGSTVIIGGLRRDEETDNKEQVPWLGDIPILGFLFRSGTKTVERTELMVVMTPHISSGDVLMTGDERDFGHKSVKEYLDYDAFTEDADVTASYGKPPDLRIKPYKEYSDLKD